MVDCFRRPDDFLPADVPRLLLSYADFTDHGAITPERFAGPRREKRFDFVYVCEADPGKQWGKEWVKNWPLARRCLPVLVRDLGLRGALVGRAEIPDLADLSCDVARDPAPSREPGLTLFPSLPWAELMRLFCETRFLLVTSVTDPAPRIIAEALALDVPVVVNADILGGWHLVTPFTGTLFESEHDIAAAVARLRAQPLSPRRWWGAHQGPWRAGERLSRFLARRDPRARRARWVRLLDQIAEPGEGWRGAVEKPGPSLR